ncbi:MAG: DUF4956 domain-containing protein [Oscillospiraceae bacterium]|nr:DUF4956 domain-containing protein [Oscillospiraceae bacterium]
MSVIDSLKNSVLEGFDTTLAPSDIICSLLVSMLAGLFILFIYSRTMRQVTLNRSFCISLLLICSISAMMVLTITSNLALSLGMVGALSIVRFRTAIKDASDTAFLFWAVAVGITSGAGFFLLTLLGCLFVGVVCVVAMLLYDKVDKPYLLVIRSENGEIGGKVVEALQKAGLHYRMSSMVDTGSYTELIYEVGVKGGITSLVSDVKDIDGVTHVSLVDCRK